jgi:protease-4
VYSGTRALGVGLVDKTGGFEEACRRAMELAKVPTERFELHIVGGPDKRFSLLKLLLSGAHAGMYALCPTAWGLLGFRGGERFR